MLNFLLIILPFLWMGFPIIATIAVNKVAFLYHEDTNKAGFKLKRRTWGPSYKDTKKIIEMTNDDFTRQKARESIRLWNISYYCLYASIILFIIVGFLNN